MDVLQWPHLAQLESGGEGLQTHLCPLQMLWGEEVGGGQGCRLTLNSFSPTPQTQTGPGEAN